VAHLRLFKGNRPHRVELTGESYVIGRGHGCDITLDSDAVSRRHARIARCDQAFHVEDLGSRNKTYLNGTLVTAPTPLVDNDIIRICSHHIIFLSDSTTDSSKFQVILKKGTEDSTRIRLLHHAQPEGSDLGLHQQARPREKLEALLEINRAFSGVCRSEMLLARVLDCLFSIFPQTDRCYILIRNELTGEPTVKTGRNRQGSPDPTPRLSRTILYHVFDQGEALLAEDALHDPQLGQHGSVMANLIHSIMCAPLPGEGPEPSGAIWMHTEDANRSFGEGDLDLLVSVASMVRLGLQRVRMHDQLLEHDRRLGESEAGRNIQQTFLPYDWPSVPGFRFYANCRPALSVGGDYFGFMKLPGHRIAIALADVSGNGMAAALLMARLSSELRFAAINSADPVAAVQSLNQLLAQDWPPDRFVTLLYSELNHATNTLTLVNAGHMPPLLRKASGSIQTIGDRASGPPLNSAATYPFQALTLQLECGELVLFYTDGLVDSQNPRMERFGLERLKQTLAKSSADPGQAGDSIMQSAAQFLEGNPQLDDLALVCFGRD
jgi:serine phosphatase RsbU (regulator of sigma subunit)